MQPTCVNVFRELGKLEKSVKKDDLLILYFCGHGIEAQEQQLLLMKEACLTDKYSRERSTMPLIQLKKRIEEFPCQGRLLLLDTCRETEESLQKTAGEASSLITNSNYLTSGGNWQVQPGKISATLYSCSEKQKTYHGRDGSFFAKALIDGISGNAADADGKVTLVSLDKYVKKYVSTTVKNDIGRSAFQMPYLDSTPPNDMILSPGRPEYIACPPFECDFNNDTGKVCSEMLQTYFAESGKLFIVERTKLNIILADARLSVVGITKPEKNKILGELLNAKYLFAGSVRRVDDVGNQLYLTVGLVDRSNGEVIPGMSADITTDVQNLRIGIRTIGEKLLKKMKGDEIGGDPPPSNAKGSLRIESNPPGAKVFVGGLEISGVTPVMVPNLPVGDMTIVISCEGYGDVSQNIVIQPDKQESLSITLPKLQGVLTVKSKPVGAKVYLDNIEKGLTTPAGLALIGVSVGRHKIKVVCDRYRDWTTDIDVINQSNKVISAELIGLPSKVIISTSPKGALVQLDGNNVGVSLLTLLNIEPGKHTVRVSMPGYDFQQRNINLLPAGAETMIFNLEEARIAKLTIKTNPPGIRGRIYLNGKDTGKSTPCTFKFHKSDLDPYSNSNQMNVALVNKDYERFERNVVIELGSSISLDANMDEITTGSLLVKCNIEGSKVYIDNRSFGVITDRQLFIENIGNGVVNVRVEKDGYSSRDCDINIRKRKEHDVYLKMSSESSIKFWRQVPMIILVCGLLYINRDKLKQ
jgi:TolB-like protein